MKHTIYTVSTGRNARWYAVTAPMTCPHAAQRVLAWFKRQPGNAWRPFQIRVTPAER